MKYTLPFIVAAGTRLLQTSITRPKWKSALQTGRLPLGAVQSRMLKSAIFSRTLAGAPNGEYVLIQHETRFEFKPQATKTITAVKEWSRPGRWPAISSSKRVIALSISM